MTHAQASDTATIKFKAAPTYNYMARQGAIASATLSLADRREARRRGGMSPVGKWEPLPAKRQNER